MLRDGRTGQATHLGQMLSISLEKRGERVALGFSEELPVCREKAFKGVQTVLLELCLVAGAVFHQVKGWHKTRLVLEMRGF